MKIIDTVKMPGYTQWIEGFVKRVLKNARIVATEAIITHMKNECINLTVDNEGFTIRTASFFPVGRDQDGITCSEDVEYILYSGYAHCEEIQEPTALTPISSGVLNINWVNDPQYFRNEVEQYCTLHGIPKQLAEPQEGEYVTLRMVDVNMTRWDIHADVRPLAEDEIQPVIDYLVTGNLAKKHRTPNILRFISGVHQYCVQILIDLCFEDGFYDHDYALSLIDGALANDLCCEDCAMQERIIITGLHLDYLLGDENAEDRIKGSLSEFFKLVKPYSITLLQDDITAA